MTLVRIFFVILIAGPLVLGTLNFFKNRGAGSAFKRRAHFAALINSAVMYSLAFNLVFFIQELSLVLGKKYLGLTAYLYHNNHSWDGSHPMESFMQGSGALAIFVFGILCLGLFYMIRGSRSIWKVLVMWLAFNGLIQSVPQVMVAFFARYTDVGQALSDYLKLGETTLALLAVTSIVATILISISFSRLLLELAPSEMAVATPKSRTSFVTYVGAGAALVGSLLVIPFRVPPASQMIGPFILWLFAIPWIWSVAGRMTKFETVPNSINEKVHWVPIILLLVLLAVFRIVLAPGIKF